jgi:hypothetical protein
MYFRAPLAALRPEGGRGAFVAAILCSLAVLALGFYPAPLMKACVEAGRGRQEAGGAPAQRAGEQEVRSREQEAGGGQKKVQDSERRVREAVETQRHSSRRLLGG